MEVMRWFQLQPNVEVGINTGRPASVKSETMRALNELGTEYKVGFTDELVHMNPGDWGEEVERSKVEGLSIALRRWAVAYSPSSTTSRPTCWPCHAPTRTGTFCFSMPTRSSNQGSPGCLTRT